MNEIHHLEEAYEHYKNDPEFVRELVRSFGNMQADRHFFIMQKR